MNEEYIEEKEIENEDKAFLQLRQDAGGNMLHIQGYGSVGNRPYGYAGRFSVPDCVAEAVREYVDDMYMSLASDSRIYFRDILELYRYWDGVQIHIYVPSKHNNTEDGFILDLSSPMCAGLMEWATTNNLITDIEEKNKYKGETDA